MDDAIRKAEALIEALSYIRTFRDRLTVVSGGQRSLEELRAAPSTMELLQEGRRSDDPA